MQIINKTFNQKKMERKKLYKYSSKGYIGGVCYGMGQHTGVDPIIWRMVAVFGGCWFIYILLWLFLDEAPRPSMFRVEQSDNLQGDKLQDDNLQGDKLQNEE